MDTVNLSAAHAAAIVDLYDTIGHAHRVYKPCQGSAFRIVIEDKMREAEAAFAAIEKPPRRLPKETVELTEQDAALLADFGKALAGADAAYPKDNDGNTNFRAFAAGAYQAPANQALMTRLKAMLVTQPPEQHD